MKSSNSPWIAQQQFVNAPKVNYRTLDGVLAGKVRTVSGSGNKFGAGNLTYVAIHDAGHMVPFDQPYVLFLNFLYLVSPFPPFFPLVHET